MNSDTRTTKVQAAIASLENELAELRAKREKLEIDLQAAYENGTDTTTVTASLSETTALITTQVKALVGLDQTLCEVSARENREEQKKLESETLRRYRDARAQLEKAIRPLASTARALLPNADAAIAKIRREVVESAWAACNEEFSDTYLSRVPAIVHAAPERNDSGERVDGSTGTLHHRR